MAEELQKPETQNRPDPKIEEIEKNLTEASKKAKESATTNNNTQQLLNKKVNDVVNKTEKKPDDSAAAKINAGGNGLKSILTGLTKITTPLDTAIGSEGVLAVIKKLSTDDTLTTSKDDIASFGKILSGLDTAITSAGFENYFKNDTVGKLVIAISGEMPPPPKEETQNPVPTTGGTPGADTPPPSNEKKSTPKPKAVGGIVNNFNTIIGAIKGLANKLSSSEESFNTISSITGNANFQITGTGKDVHMSAADNITSLKNILSALNTAVGGVADWNFFADTAIAIHLNGQAEVEATEEVGNKGEAGYQPATTGQSAKAGVKDNFNTVMGALKGLANKIKSNIRLETSTETSTDADTTTFGILKAIATNTFLTGDSADGTTAKGSITLLKTILENINEGIGESGDWKYFQDDKLKNIFQEIKENSVFKPGRKEGDEKSKSTDSNLTDEDKDPYEPAKAGLVKNFDTVMKALKALANKVNGIYTKGDEDAQGGPTTVMGLIKSMTKEGSYFTMEGKGGLAGDIEGFRTLLKGINDSIGGPGDWQYFKDDSLPKLFAGTKAVAADTATNTQAQKAVAGITGNFNATMTALKGLVIAVDNTYWGGGKANAANFTAKSVGTGDKKHDVSAEEQAKAEDEKNSKKVFNMLETIISPDSWFVQNFSKAESNPLTKFKTIFGNIGASLNEMGDIDFGKKDTDTFEKKGAIFKAAISKFLVPIINSLTPLLPGTVTKTRENVLAMDITTHKATKTETEEYQEAKPVGDFLKNIEEREKGVFKKENFTALTNIVNNIVSSLVNMEGFGSSIDDLKKIGFSFVDVYKQEKKPDGTTSSVKTGEKMVDFKNILSFINLFSAITTGLGGQNMNFNMSTLKTYGEDIKNIPTFIEDIRKELDKVNIPIVTDPSQKGLLQRTTTSVKKDAAGKEYDSIDSKFVDYNNVFAFTDFLVKSTKNLVDSVANIGNYNKGLVENALKGCLTFPQIINTIKVQFDLCEIDINNFNKDTITWTDIETGEKKEKESQFEYKDYKHIVLFTSIYGKVIKNLVDISNSLKEGKIDIKGLEVVEEPLKVISAQMKTLAKIIEGLNEADIKNVDTAVKAYTGIIKSILSVTQRDEKTGDSIMSKFKANKTHLYSLENLGVPQRLREIKRFSLMMANFQKENGEKLNQAISIYENVIKIFEGIKDPIKVKNIIKNQIAFKAISLKPIINQIKTWAKQAEAIKPEDLEKIQSIQTTFEGIMKLIEDLQKRVKSIMVFAGTLILIQKVFMKLFSFLTDEKFDSMLLKAINNVTKNVEILEQFLDRTSEQSTIRRILSIFTSLDEIQERIGENVKNFLNLSRNIFKISLTIIEILPALFLLNKYSAKFRESINSLTDNEGILSSIHLFFKKIQFFDENMKKDKDGRNEVVENLNKTILTVVNIFVNISRNISHIIKAGLVLKLFVKNLKKLELKKDLEELGNLVIDYLSFEKKIFDWVKESEKKVEKEIKATQPTEVKKEAEKEAEKKEELKTEKTADGEKTTQTDKNKPVSPLLSIINNIIELISIPKSQIKRLAKIAIVFTVFSKGIQKIIKKISTDIVKPFMEEMKIVIQQFSDNKANNSSENLFKFIEKMLLIVNIITEKGKHFIKNYIKVHNFLTLVKKMMYGITNIVIDINKMLKDEQSNSKILTEYQKFIDKILQTVFAITNKSFLKMALFPTKMKQFEKGFKMYIATMKKMVPDYIEFLKLIDKKMKEAGLNTAIGEKKKEHHLVLLEKYMSRLDKTADKTKKQSETFSTKVASITKLFKTLGKIVLEIGILLLVVAIAKKQMNFKGAMEFVGMTAGFFVLFYFLLKRIGGLGGYRLHSALRTVKLLNLTLLTLALTFVLVSIASKGIDIVGFMLFVGLVGVTIGLMFLLRILRRSVKKGAVALLIVSVALLTLALTFVIISMVSTKINPIGFLLFIGLVVLAVGILFIINLLKVKLLMGALALLIISGTFLMFAFTLLIISLITTALNPLGLVFFIAIIAAAVGVLFLIRTFESSVIMGAVGLLVISIAFVVFALVLWFINEKVHDVKWENFAMFFGIVGTAVGALWAVSKFSKAGLVKGAAALVITGIALAICAGVFWFINEKVHTLKIENFTMFAGIVGIAVGALWSVSKFGKAGIMKGAASLAVVGVALAICAGVFWFINEKVKNIKVGNFAMFGAVVGIAAGIAIGLGVTPVNAFVAAGAAIMIVLGVALISLAIGVKAIASINFPSDPKILEKGFKTIFNIFDMLASTFRWPWKVAQVMSGSFAMFYSSGALAMTAKSLVNVAEGIKEFDAITKTLDIGTYDKPGTLMKRIRTVIHVIKDSFGEIGASKSHSVLSLLTGINLSPTDTERGIKSVLQAGEALMQVAVGIQSFDEFTKDLDIGTTKNPGRVLKNIQSVLQVVQTEFSKIGKTGSGSLLKSVFGLDFSKTDVEKGIASVKDLGKTLTEIANSLKEWADLESQGIDINKIKNNIYNVINCLQGLFAKMGGGGLLPIKVFGLSILSVGDKSDQIRDGIESVEGLGNVLKSIAFGLKEWANLQEQGIDIEKIKNNIYNVVTCLSGVFGQIGKQDGGVNAFGLTLSKGTIEKGIDSLKNAGNVAKSIADAIKAFGEAAEKTNVTEQAYNISRSLLIISEAFGLIGKNATFTGKTKRVYDKATGKWEDVSEWYSSDTVEKGVKALKGAGQEAKDIAYAVETMGKVAKTTDVNQQAKNISSVISIVAEAFGLLGAKVVETGEIDSNGNKVWYNSKQVEKGIKSIKGAGIEAKEIAYAITEFAKIQKDKGDANQIAQVIKNSLKVIAQAFAEIANDKQLNGGQVEKGVKILKGAGDEVKKVAESFKAVNDIIKDKEFNIDKTKEGIQNIIKTLVDLFSSMGGKSKDSSMKLPSPEEMNPIKNNLKQLTELIKKINEPVEAFKSIKLQDGAAQKTKRSIIDFYKAILDSMKVMNQGIPKTNSANAMSIMQMTTMLQIISTAYSRIKIKFPKDIDKMSDSFLRFANIIGKNITTDKKRLTAGDQIVGFIERFSKVEEPFERFQKTFKEHVKDFEKYIEILNKIDTSKMAVYDKFNQTNLKLISDPGNSINEKSNFIHDEIKTFFEEATKYTESLAQLAQSVDNVRKQDWEQQKATGQGLSGSEQLTALANNMDTQQSTSNLKKAIQDAISSNGPIQVHVVKEG